MPLVIATWNVNSVRAREERLLAFLERTGADVVCLQELKVADEAFPLEAVRSRGYHAVVYGQKTYNGVAILAREEPTDARRGMGEGNADSQARLVEARVRGVRVASAYFPNGERVGSEKWAYKLAWMERLRAHLAATAVPGEPFALCGDFNVAPEDRDVARPERWKDTVLCHPDARAALARIAAVGFEDAFRRVRPDAGLYSWWDYRMLGFPKNDGLRIDHIFATAPLVARASAAEIDRNERKGKGPSDHVPVLVTFQD